MPKSKVFERGVNAGEVGFNMTPMIDCTFQLILFFILAGQIASAERSLLFLPQPVQSQAMPEDRMKPAHRVIVNVVSRGDTRDRSLVPQRGAEALRYEILGEWIDLGDTTKLVERISRKKAAAGDQDFFVEVRADLRVNFGYVKPVMDAAAEAGVPKMNITALLEVGG